MNARLITILILLVGCIPAATVQGALVANKPTFSAGDYWEYQDFVTGNTVKMSIGTGTVSFGGQTCIEFNGQITLNGDTTNTSAYYRASDLAEVGWYMKTLSSGMTLKSTTLDDPPVTQYHYPMKVGDKWKFQTVLRSTSEMSSGSYYSKTYNNQTIDTNYTVESEEQVTVAAGTFDTFKITAYNTGTSNTEYEWYAPKAGHSVKLAASFTSTILELKSYQFKNVPSGGGTTTTSSGTMVYVIIIVIVIVVILVVVMVVIKKKAALVPPGMAIPVASAQTPQAPPPQYPPPQ
jgi:hypothetical protein